MKSRRELLSRIALLIPGLGWTVPMFTQLYKKYPAFGSIHLYGMVLGAVLGIACAVVYYITDGDKSRSKKGTIATSLIVFVTAVLTGNLWAPCINALLDFGPKTTVMGTIYGIDSDSRSRFGPSARVVAVIDGVEREAAFHPHQYFWDVAAVRNGGPVQLTVRPGFLGIPWVVKFSDP